MTSRLRATGIVLMLGVTLAGCEGTAPGAPSRIPPPVDQPAPGPSVIVFREPASIFATSDLRDAQEQIVQFNTAGELIWAADGTRLPGYQVQGNFIPAEKICKCAFEVRFGTQDGERRAYLTAEYGHFNPGTVVDLEVVGGSLVMNQTALYPPGSFTLSGVITELTPAGPVPVVGVWVARLVGDGWREVKTDGNGFYAIPGLYDGTGVVSVGPPGYQRVTQDVAIKGDTRFDIQLVRK